MSNAGQLVTGAQLGQILRPQKPIGRSTIHRWTVEGYLPKAAVVHFGGRVRYKLSALVDAGWLVRQ